MPKISPTATVLLPPSSMAGRSIRLIPQVNSCRDDEALLEHSVEVERISQAYIRNVRV